jgi:O-antigen ligase
MMGRKLLSYLAVLFLALYALFCFNFSVIISQQAALYIFLPGAFILAFCGLPNGRASTTFKLLMAVYLWECITFLSAEDKAVALDELKRLTACFMLAFSFFYLGKKRKLIPWLYFVYVVYYLGMVYYADKNILIGTFDYTEERLNDDILNANQLAYLTFFITFLLYISPTFFSSNRLKRALNLLFLLSPIWSFWIAILTGSRQVLVIQFPLTAILLYDRYLRQTKVSTQVISIIAALILLPMFWERADNIYEDSFLSTRMEMQIEEDARMIHLQRAIRIGLDNPVTGVGPGNYKLYTTNKLSFSHSSYLELFANTGFPGLILYVFMLFYFIKKQWMRYKRTLDDVFLNFLIFGLFYAIDNIFYVMHLDPWLISFFFLVDSHSQTHYQSLIKRFIRYQ